MLIENKSTSYSDMKTRKRELCASYNQLYAIGKKEKPPYVQAHLIFLVSHKIKRAFTAQPPPKHKYENKTHSFLRYKMNNCYLGG